ncbi:glycosyltransferase family 2 protein [Pediococcus inopinatus]|uniref:Glycosyltransferase family 2 protein n=1 Tax=Pediococcus inopinatus TaxID=114090 RepID=A0ABZ0Q517_9LACO|nr:glycosyltransferase family 2 protein [Pediococcus inopinatus]WPC16905.1 glycosyltransferase family 2 protein [Pediococcus inopinatus]WPC19976.1 glycosyltransferase family 2 protein [Pediococcus inopinatus]WPC21678.1 glycosyltransferase family 2 protein [Pediococcus inopinatus]WPP09392.1 glycosyltransferase family 2 protein [Pediococcus inopinatus]
MQTVSMIVPCFNEQESVPIYFDAITKVFEDPQMRDYSLELWLIDDGSSDATLTELKKLNTQHPETAHYISFSRNFGKESAILAGLQAATGEIVGLMDVDLQDPPELLPKMLRELRTGEYDTIGTRRVGREGEPAFRSFLSNLFYKLINKISKVEIIPNARDYRVMNRKVVEAVLDMPEINRFSKGIFSWVGFKTKYLDFENRERVAGNTSWSLWQLFEYSLEAIIDFSAAPLAIASFVGILACIISVIAVIFIIFRTIFFGDTTAGWPSLAAIILFIGGIQLFCLGILGNYVGRIYSESKHRPIYIINEKK